MISRVWLWLKSHPWVIALGAVLTLLLDIVLRSRPKVVVQGPPVVDLTKSASASGAAGVHEERAEQAHVVAERIEADIASAKPIESPKPLEGSNAQILAELNSRMHNLPRE